MRRTEKNITMNEIWTQTCSMEILIYLLDKKQAILSEFVYDMRRSIINANTIYLALKKLEDADLIKEEGAVAHMGNKRLFSITPLGVEIALLAKQQKEMLENHQKTTVNS